jgi:hypothetical protein
MFGRKWSPPVHLSDRVTGRPDWADPPQLQMSARDKHAPGSQTLAAPLFVPVNTGRRRRRRAQRKVRAVEATARRARLDAERDRVRAEREERRRAEYLPPGGQPGPDALRCYRRLRVPPHRATSEVLGAAYPFLAEAGLDVEGLFIGQDAWSGSSFCFDPWVLYEKGVLTNPNCLLAGVVGKG